MSKSGFVESLLAAMPTNGAKLACLSVLGRWAGATVYLPSDSKSKRRQLAAKHMLDNAMLPGDVVRALRERFGVSDRTAFRDVSIARKMS
jgi:hypothetical protein